MGLEGGLNACTQACRAPPCWRPRARGRWPCWRAPQPRSRGPPRSRRSGEQPRAGAGSNRRSPPRRLRAEPSQAHQLHHRQTAPCPGPVPGAAAERGAGGRRGLPQPAPAQTWRPRSSSSSSGSSGATAAGWRKSDTLTRALRPRWAPRASPGTCQARTRTTRRRPWRRPSRCAWPPATLLALSTARLALLWLHTSRAARGHVEHTKRSHLTSPRPRCLPPPSAPRRCAWSHKSSSTAAGGDSRSATACRCAGRLAQGGRQGSATARPHSAGACAPSACGCVRALAGRARAEGGGVAQRRARLRQGERHTRPHPRPHAGLNPQRTSQTRPDVKPCPAACAPHTPKAQRWQRCGQTNVRRRCV